MLRFAIYEAEAEVIMVRFKRGSVTKHTPCLGICSTATLTLKNLFD